MTTENYTPLKYPVLFLHGFGFRDGKKNKYWGRIPDFFEKAGCKVYFGCQEGGATTEDNALFLKGRTEEILRETSAEKVNIIAHSKGGLEARYLISSLGMADKVASLTTIGTPHRGSKTMDKFPKWTFKISAFFTHIGMRIIGDKHPQVYKVYVSFRASEMEKFNLENPDNDKVYYQSYAFVLNKGSSLWLPHKAIKRFEGDNDGLVSTYSAEWGDFKGVKRGNGKRGISHGDETDVKRKPFASEAEGGVSDILEIYEEIMQTLYNKGF
ncbi:MAG: hypothetical protein LUD27_08515 [Clostridia bacterium]|nr:hypothetical protein [Clostridia bacterium]